MPHLLEDVDLDAHGMIPGESFHVLEHIVLHSHSGWDDGSALICVTKLCRELKVLLCCLRAGETVMDAFVEPDEGSGPKRVSSQALHLHFSSLRQPGMVRRAAQGGWPLFRLDAFLGCASMWHG